MSSGERAGDTGDSTLEAVSGIGERRHAAHGLWLRRATVAVLAATIAAAGAGLLGVMSATATAQSGGYRVDVTYARIARAGLEVPFTIRVQAPRPIVRGVVIGVSADYFSIFESQGSVPEPTDVASDADTVYLRFAPPPSGDVLAVAFDASIQPAARQRGSASIRIQVDGTWRLSTDVHTTLIP